MKQKAYCCTVEELNKRGPEDLPSQFRSNMHLIYSSPATLAFNSPGAEGFGVKRAGLAVPDSVMLIVAPGCCGRNTSMISSMPQYQNRFFYLTMDETDIVTGRHLKKIPHAVEDVCQSLAKKPSVVMICITCVDALLGTDMERVCRKAEERAGVPVRPCYMYALTREGRKPPMVHVRQSLYSLLEPAGKKGTVVNLLGYFSPLIDDCELYGLLQKAGVKTIHEISRCRDFAEFQTMAEANFNLVLHPEARFAAEDFHNRLKIPFIELRRLYQADKIENQYQALGRVLGTEFKDDEARQAAQAAVEKFRRVCPDAAFAVGECMNGDPFELALALVKYGFRVKEIFGTITGENFVYIRQLVKLSPETKIFSNMEPTMLYYEPADSGVNFAVGKDAVYYHPECPGIMWNEERQPFGYAGVRLLFEKLAGKIQQAEETVQKPEKRAGVKSGPENNRKQKEETGALSVRKNELLRKAGSSGQRRLRKYLTPFAPDQSGAVSVLYELGGILVICDAGGCTGNVCGFDEPRWFGRRSAVFSAGLRDMDAILGRDDRLVQKLADASKKLDAQFAAVIGTPVPAVIGTDYRALKRMAEKKIDLPILTVDANGMELYDSGEEKAWLALFKTFAKEKFPVEPGLVGVLGMAPQDVSDLDAAEKVRRSLKEAVLEAEEKGTSGILNGENFQTKRVVCYGMENGLEAVKEASAAEWNLVVSPAALKTAMYLEKNFGTPFRVGYPPAKYMIPDRDYTGKKILIVHQQVIANALREEIAKCITEGNIKAGGEDGNSEKCRKAEIQAACWFMMKPELTKPGDIALKEEDDYISLVRDGGFDMIFADECMKPMTPDFAGEFIDTPHFGVSGRLNTR